MKILFTGGGTGGHIFPIIAIARDLQNYYLEANFQNDLQLFFIGPKGEIPLTELTQEGIKVKIILAGKVRRYFTVLSFFQNIIDVLFKIPFGIIQAFFYVFFLAPDVIFSKGGYGSIPAIIAGRLLGTPIFIHESDAMRGLANRFSHRFALEIFTSFSLEETEHFPREKMISVGNPIRQRLLEIFLEGDKEESKKLFQITGEKPLILFLGGSQGAQRINDVIYQSLNDLLTDFEIIHQAGPKNFKEAQSLSEVIINESLKRNYHLYPFLNETELARAMVLADLIISRAGSGSIFEIAAFGKPSILIPLFESAQNHQLENAYLFSEKGACLVIEEANLTPHFLLDRLRYLFSHPSRLKEMGEKAQYFARPKSSQVIASYIIEYLTK